MSNTCMKATVEIAGMGRVYVDTYAHEIRIYSEDCVSSGSPVNVRTRKVSRDRRHYAEADRANAAGYSLTRTHASWRGTEVFALHTGN